jgi:S-formylglutathione hydrolase
MLYPQSSSTLQLRSASACFGGRVEFYTHASRCCQCNMNFAVFVPPQAQEPRSPVLYFLSGLTCTEENFITKAGAQRVAAELGLILVAPDTSPRGDRVPDEPSKWDFGQGAGFYVDAVLEPWLLHFQMYSYITQELPALVQQHFPVAQDKQGPIQGIFGHSMGGHGALVCALRNPQQYRSVSALAPIVAPTQCPWGQQAFSGYLGGDRQLWANYDATELVQHRPLPYPILIDQGLEDPFLAPQLKLELFEAACQSAGQVLLARHQGGYDHSYYFIASFIEDHLRHHARTLVNPESTG